MRKLMVLSAAAILLGTASTNAREYEVSEGAMDAVLHILNAQIQQQNGKAITNIQHLEAQDSDGNLHGFTPKEDFKTAATGDPFCWSMFAKKHTYYEGANFILVWCQESDYDPADRRLQEDLYYGDSPLERVEDDVSCSDSEKVPVEAYKKLCIDTKLPRKDQ